MSKGKGGGKHYSPNDMRSMAKNQNNPASKATADNRAMQLNPKTPTYSSSRKATESEEGRGWSSASGSPGVFHPNWRTPEDERPTMIDNRSDDEIRRPIVPITKGEPKRGEIGSLSVSYTEKVCYICGRSIDELVEVQRVLRDSIEEDTDRSVAPWQKALKKKEERILKILESVGNRDNVALEFSVSKVERDLPKFQKLIPGVDEILWFYHKYLPKPRHSDNDDPTLLEVIDRLEKADVPDGKDQWMVNVYRWRKVPEIAKLHEKQLYFKLNEEGHVPSVPEGESWSIEKGKDLLRFTIYICDICNTLLREGSGSEFNAPHSRSFI